MNYIERNKLEVAALLSHPAMPGVFKLAHARNIEKLEPKLKRLSASPSLPGPFRIEEMVLVRSRRSVLNAFDQVFSTSAANSRRRFYVIHREQGLAFLRAVATENVPEEMQDGLARECLDDDAADLDRLRAKLQA
jgi:hypothetical protein